VSQTMQEMKILFLCTGNSCRSQMAEAWTRHLKGDRIEAFSAGVVAVERNDPPVVVTCRHAVSLRATVTPAKNSGV